MEHTKVPFDLIKNRKFMKAKKKTIHAVALNDLNVSVDGKGVTYKNFELPPEKPQVKMLSGAQELVKLLREESKVI